MLINMVLTIPLARRVQRRDATPVFGLRDFGSAPRSRRMAAMSVCPFHAGLIERRGAGGVPGIDFRPVRKEYPNNFAVPSIRGEMQGSGAERGAALQQNISTTHDD